VFAERLSEAIRERGWSQNEAGRYLGVTGKQVGRYISGEQQPTLPVAIRLADRLGVTLDELAGRAEPASEPREVTVLVDGEAWQARPIPTTHHATRDEALGAVRARTAVVLEAAARRLRRTGT
jgi:transcriptional regulator with XRE-family HTH domain